MNLWATMTCCGSSPARLRLHLSTVPGRFGGLSFCKPLKAGWTCRWRGHLRHLKVADKLPENDAGRCRRASGLTRNQTDTRRVSLLAQRRHLVGAHGVCPLPPPRALRTKHLPVLKRRFRHPSRAHILLGTFPGGCTRKAA